MTLDIPNEPLNIYCSLGVLGAFIFYLNMDPKLPKSSRILYAVIMAFAWPLTIFAIIFQHIYDPQEDDDDEDDNGPSSGPAGDTP